MFRISGKEQIIKVTGRKIRFHTEKYKNKPRPGERCGALVGRKTFGKGVR